MVRFRVAVIRLAALGPTRGFAKTGVGFFYTASLSPDGSIPGKRPERSSIGRSVLRSIPTKGVGIFYTDTNPPISPKLLI